MQNQMQIFENKEFGQVRVIEKDGQPWFVGKDVSDILGYVEASNALKMHVEDEDKLTHQFSGTGQRRNMTIINESGLYSLIFSSKLPTAKAFKRWVTSEVLPSIRKHGAYMTDDTLQKIREDSAFTDELIEKLAAERAKKGALLEYVEKLAPKARYYDIILQCTNAVQVSIIAKDYGMTASAFNKLLHAFGVQYRIGNTWLLYKEHSDMGYTVTRTYQVNPYKSAIHTYWTQRGRYFIYKLLSWHGILPESEKYAVN